MRELQANLRSVEAYLDACEQVQPAAFFMRDLEGNQHFWSPEVFQWFGLPVAARAPSMDEFLALIVTRQRSEMIAAVRRHLQGVGRFVCEYHVRQPGGAIKHVRSIGQTLPSRIGQGVALVGTLFDLTDHHRARFALRKAMDALGASDPTGTRGQLCRCNHDDLTRDTIDMRSADEDRGIQAEAPRFAGVSGGLSARQFSRVCELMEVRLREPLSVKEMAAVAGLSAAHFARAFRRTTGKSPHRFMVEQRLQRARLALRRDPGDKLAKVAVNFGFFDQSHFTRHFRRKFGVTPTEFLRRSMV